MKRFSLWLGLVLALSACAPFSGFGVQTTPPVLATPAQATLEARTGGYRLSAGSEPLGKTYVLISGYDLKVYATACAVPLFTGGDFRLMRSSCAYERIDDFTDVAVEGVDVTVRALTYSRTDETTPLELCYPADVCEPP